ncbi:glycosyltransferase family 2 protein [Magnetospira sp. QH-2]|uniref:glycosyltransferase family 2 protein n=1 Tax=Magnetospira sp. (strain QH-2) TaxID=1288970 RepID=UPI0003E81B96|nr:glycosyltransferase family 2 protein [Magnetospira sp. QH-2]CCQ75474.1 putative GT2 [Magnetospira sp. QH-2]
MTKESVSVIIPAYRSAGTIRRALESVARQSRLPDEVVVVDDGSDDGTLEATEACRALLKNIDLTVIQQKNGGAGAARNRAIAESRGSVLAFLDADDEWLPTKLERSLDHMAAGGYVLVAHNGWIVDGESRDLNDCAARFNEPRDPYRTLYRKGYIDTCTVVATRDAVLAVGGFDESLPNAQDFDLWLNMLKDPKARFLVFDEPLSLYYITPNSIMSNTERRLSCTLRVAYRYREAVRKRSGPIPSDLWYRIIAIHLETILVYRSRGAMVPLMRTLLRLPWRLITSLFAPA